MSSLVNCKGNSEGSELVQFLTVRYMMIPALAGVVIVSLAGCAMNVLAYPERLYDREFAGLEMPPQSSLAAGTSRTFPTVARDEAWDAAVGVLMQQGIVVKASKEHGTILAVTGEPVLPWVVLVEGRDSATVRVNWAVDICPNRMKRFLLERSWQPRTTVQFKRPSQDAVESFYSAVETQATAGRRWKYIGSSE